MRESMRYRAIGNWWNTKRGEEQSEIDVIAITADDKTAEVYEAKRDRQRFRKALLERKAEILCSQVHGMGKHRLKLGCLLMEDM